MAGRAPQEWQPRPSQLRNEMRHTPSDDSRVFVGEEIQVPDSQAEVPDTQIRSGSLSPTSAALVRSNTVTKKMAPISFSSPSFKAFAKEPSLGESSHPALPSVGFAWAEKPVPKSKKPLGEAENDVRAVEQLDTADEKPPGSCSPTASTEPVIASSLQAPSVDVGVGKKSEALPCSIVHHDGTAVKEDNDLREVHEHFSDAPTSAQLTSSHPEARKKLLVATKVKKVKKRMQGRQRDGHWPPRLTIESSQIKDTGLVLKAVSHKRGQNYKAGPSDALPVIPENDQAGATADGVSGYEPRTDLDDRNQGQISPLTAPNVPKASPIGSLQSTSPRPTRDKRFPASRSPAALLEEKSNPNNILNIPVGTPEMQEKPKETTASPPKPYADAVEEFGQHNTGSIAPATQTAHSRERQAQLRNLLDRGDATLRSISSRAVPHRVEKSQKQRRSSKATQQSSASALLRLQGSSKQLSFEQTWDMLRAAHHSDLTRKDYDVTRQAEHFEEVKALLRGQINQYSMSLAEEKSQHEGLKISMSHLREKAKTNQKFAAGLQKDYEKLKKVALDCQEECKQTLQQKASELENEKEVLRREVSLVLDNVAKGHKKLKATADELCLRLEFSEAKRRTLKNELTKQTVLYAEERATRNDLEGRILSLGPSMQEHLRDHYSQLIEKLEKLQASVHDISSPPQQQQNPAGVEECLEILQQLQGTPFLTLEHGKKFETMLRAVYEGLGTRLENLAKSVKTESQPTVDLQVFIKEHLGELQSAILKSDELVADNRKTQDANTTLRQQLEAQQEVVQRLRKEIDNLHQHEQKLETTRADLVTQVTNLKDTTRDHCEELTAVRQNAEELQRELTQLQDKCELTKAESERLRLDLQRRDREVDEYNASIKKLQEENKRLAEKAKHKHSSEVDLRKQIGDDLNHEFDQEIRKFQGDIDRVTKERDESDLLVWKHNEKISAAKARFEEAENNIRKLHSELEAARKGRIEMDSQLKKAQQAAQKESKAAVEVANLKEKLKQKEKTIEDCEKEFEQLQCAYDDLDTQTSDLRTMCEEQQMEINQHPSKLENLRRELEHESIAKQQKEEAATKQARTDATNMRKERDNAHAKLEKSQLLAAALVSERDTLKLQSAELEKTRKINESRIVHHEEEGVTRAREHEEKLRELQRQLEQSTEAFRMVEAKVKLQQAEHAKKIEFDRTKYESMVQKLTRDLEEARSPASIEQDTAHVQRSLQPEIRSDANAHDVQNSNSKKSRKKVDRGNHSGLTFAGFSGTSVTPTLMPVNGARSKSPHGHGLYFDRNDNLFEEESDRCLEEDGLWDQDLALRDPDSDPIEDTQEMPSIATVLKDMDASLDSDRSKESLRQKLPADQSSLSSPPSSNALARLSEERVVETPAREKHTHRASPPFSQAQVRPLSQANTSSRMMPPPTSSETSDRYIVNKEGSRDGPLREPGHSSRHNSTSPLDHMQHSSASNIRHSNARNLGAPRSGHHTSRPSGGDRQQKHKIILEQEGSSKRQRQSKQSQAGRSSGDSPHLSRSSHSEQDRELIPDNMSFQSRPSSSSLLGPPAVGSGSKSRVPARGNPYGSSSGSKSRDVPSSASRLTTPARSQRVYGRHQTRSKTQESDRLERELLGL